MLTIAGVTTEMFNAHERSIEAKIELYFNGIGNAPTIVSKDDYLVHFDLLEETSMSADGLFGNLSANTLSFKLLNINGMFSPANNAGVYYGKIKTAVCAKCYVRLVGCLNWVPMGVYYVYSWKARVCDIVANVMCYDNLYYVLNAPIKDLDIKENITQGAFLSYLLAGYNYTNLSISSNLSGNILYGIQLRDGIKVTLNELITSARAVLISDRFGNLKAFRITNGTPVTVMTDFDQVITLMTEQSIIKTYDGVALNYYIPQVLDDDVIITTDAFMVPVGNLTHDTIEYPKIVYSISGVCIIGDTKCTLASYITSNFGISVTTNNSGTTGDKVTLTVTGRVLEMLEQHLTDNTSNMALVDSHYIQTPSDAGNFKAYLETYVSSEVPILKATIRGNPLVEIGDILTIHSDKYNTDFTGSLQYAYYHYDGSLSCDVTLLNKDVIS